MGNIENYRARLRELHDWAPFLERESRLPGPRANLELAEAVAQEGDEAQFRRLLDADHAGAVANTPGEFVVLCGVLGLSKLLAEGKTEVMDELRRAASDPRWRVREIVATGLQKLGKHDMAALSAAMQTWSAGNLLERRAAAAALCEPALLKRREDAAPILAILDEITTSLTAEQDRKSDEFVALRKALGYCWSVAVAAFPDDGKPAMERLARSQDKDIRWIVRENLKKDRLRRMDSAWTARLQEAIGAA